MKEGTWKTLAIVFGVLFVIETLLIGWAFSLGSSAVENEAICSNEICFNGGYDSFLYDDYSETCGCYIDNELEYTEYMG